MPLWRNGHTTSSRRPSVASIPPTCATHTSPMSTTKHPPQLRTSCYTPTAITTCCRRTCQSDERASPGVALTCDDALAAMAHCTTTSHTRQNRREPATMLHTHKHHIVPASIGSESNNRDPHNRHHDLRSRWRNHWLQHNAYHQTPGVVAQPITTLTQCMVGCAHATGHPGNMPEHCYKQRAEQPSNQSAQATLEECYNKHVRAVTTPDAVLGGMLVHVKSGIARRCTKRSRAPCDSERSHTHEITNALSTIPTRRQCCSPCGATPIAR